MASNQVTLYIKGERNVEVMNREVTLGNLLSMECSDPVWLAKIKALRILKFPEGKDKNSNKKEKGQRVVISILKVISCIHESYPNIEVQNLGEQDLIVTYEPEKEARKLMHWIKTIFVTVLTFCGAAFSIMAFHNDVSLTTLFSQIYQALTGFESDGFTVLEVSYSIGIAIGIFLFFNHFGKKRFTVDPTPLEIQMRLYENDIQTTLIENASRRKEELDVDQTNSACNHRG